MTDSFFTNRLTALGSSGGISLDRDQAEACLSSGPRTLALAYQDTSVGNAWGGLRPVAHIQGDRHAFGQLGFLLLCSALSRRVEEFWMASTVAGQYLVLMRDPFHAAIGLHGAYVEKIVYRHDPDRDLEPVSLAEDDGLNPAFHLYVNRQREPLAADRFELVFEQGEPTGFDSALALSGTASARLRLGVRLLDWSLSAGAAQSFTLERRRFEVSALLESADVCFTAVERSPN